jgi:hypothetical protein
MKTSNVVLLFAPLLCNSVVFAQALTSHSQNNAGDTLLVDAGFSASQLGKASAAAQKNELIISTGTVQGRWKWTGKGFVTTGFKNLQTGKEWVNQEPGYPADWDLMIFEGDVKLVSVKADISTDEGFTSEHIRVAAEMDYGMSEKYYPGSYLRVRFEIWAYPEASGFRTQLFVKGMQQWSAPGIACSNDYLADYLPVSARDLNRQTVGFYNDHDGRNADSLDFIESTIYPKPVSGTEKHDEASILFLYDKHEGIGLVKESHKVVNKPGINTGYFECGQNGITSTGWGLALSNIKKDEYQPCWANWRICWEGGEDEKQLAFKIFDRFRYPVAKEEVVLTTNIWGGGHGAASAKEEVVVKEIKSCADLGIDVVQIDAGWEGKESPDKRWQISKEAYPDGFQHIMKLAADNKVKLGIWNRAESVNQYDDKLIDLCDEGFLYHKIDIGSWSTYDMLNELTNHARALLAHSGHKAVINWDVTHKGLRVGYLFNREYGNLFLQNRRLRMEGKSNTDSFYVPARILKDQWTATSYLNLNKIMFNVQTTEFVPPEDSNARLYGDVYSFALTMMSAPLFFTETWRYSPADREAVKKIIRVYKQYREDLYQGYVFALGERPNDAAWAGFQNYHPGRDHGYLTLFRELNNQESKKRIPLRFLKDKKLLVEDLITADKTTYTVDKNGFVEFEMNRPASFKFCKYTILQPGTL